MLSVSAQLAWKDSGGRNKLLLDGSWWVYKQDFIARFLAVAECEFDLLT